MRVSDFDYELPPELIASQPAPERRGSRLLCLDGASGALEDRQFSDLPALLRAGDLLVVNDTRVMPARLYGRKQTGGRVELLIEQVHAPERARAWLRASKPTRPGSVLMLDAGVAVRVLARDGERVELQLLDGPGFVALMDAHGHMPLPPYLRREDAPLDRERYQTVYASKPGAVAAPTAGLHLDQAMLAQLTAMGVARAAITLHVGAGTFSPIRSQTVEAHRMHAEWLQVSAEVCTRMHETRARGGRIVAVGTTVVRALESAARRARAELPPSAHAAQWIVPFEGETTIFLYPGERFLAVDALITNFHLPQSTLLMLVSAFAGREHVLAAYRHAVEQRYRFFSYGDAMFITPCAEARP
jgi:S-adenosylmethionine:tRNA ribosyltransferase-isomerase